MSGWSRWVPLTGVLAVAVMIISFAIAGSSPSSDDSDAKILSYFASTSHQHRNIAGLLESSTWTRTSSGC
jgi:hypothetical protein